MLIEKLQDQSGLTRSQLLHLSITASKRYKVYNIKKRNGGVRIISHPSKTLKAIQRWINKMLFREFPVHQCATAYRKGTNIRENALVNANSSFTLRMDFRNFFPSFSSQSICHFIENKNIDLKLTLSADDIEFVCFVVTRNGRLTIGAPSSPVITNAIMYEFDECVFELARENGLMYTRYADDLFISARGPNRLTEIANRIIEISRNFPYASLTINRKKTAYLSRRYRRSVTGLIITPEGNISIGRKRKREIKSLMHKFVQGHLPNEEIGRVRGLVSFAISVDPLFHGTICRKYGDDNLNLILGRDL